MPTLEDAIRLALDAHGGQVYPSPIPEPYILHPLRVMLGVSAGDAQIAAVLHDVIEDTDLTIEHLRGLGFEPHVIHAVDLLTRRPEEDYEQYIRNLIADPIARAVKVVDVRDNLANNRRLRRTTENLERIAKYERALAILSGA